MPREREGTSSELPSEGTKTRECHVNSRREGPGLTKRAAPVLGGTTAKAAGNSYSLDLLPPRPPPTLPCRPLSSRPI
jgi:hypothetical protein